MRFARSLRTMLLHDALRDARPLTAITGYRATENRRYYEKLLRQPKNFPILGDAACTFNRFYGQGMTTAALGAIALGEWLCEQRKHDGNTIGLARHFHKKLAKTNATPWLLATGQEFRVRGTEDGTSNLVTV
jgi:2-polyprenyl-6-methoxyphenol hydroxylase-like FAD-dependent oxidoreductase